MHRPRTDRVPRASVPLRTAALAFAILSGLAARGSGGVVRFEHVRPRAEVVRVTVEHAAGSATRPAAMLFPR